MITTAFLYGLLCSFTHNIRAKISVLITQPKAELAGEFKCMERATAVDYSLLKLKHFAQEGACSYCRGVFLGRLCHVLNTRSCLSLSS